jgi:hypothetical protein
MTVARAARYQRLVEEAAKQLKCRPSSELARHVGTLRLARETFAERLISGRDVNPADLVRLDDCLRQYLPLRAEPSEPLAVVVERQRARQNALQGRDIEVTDSGVVRILPKPGGNGGNGSDTAG